MTSRALFEVFLHFLFTAAPWGGYSSHPCITEETPKRLSPREPEPNQALGPRATHATCRADPPGGAGVRSEVHAPGGH